MGSESPSMRYETLVARFWLRVRGVSQSPCRRQSRDKTQGFWTPKNLRHVQSTLFWEAAVFRARGLVPMFTWKSNLVPRALSAFKMAADKTLAKSELTRSLIRLLIKLIYSLLVVFLDNFWLAQVFRSKMAGEIYREYRSKSDDFFFSGNCFSSSVSNNFAAIFCVEFGVCQARDSPNIQRHWASRSFAFHETCSLIVLSEACIMYWLPYYMKNWRHVNLAILKNSYLAAL